MPTHPRTLVVLLAAFSALLSALGPWTGFGSYVVRGLTIFALLCSLMGLGAVSGKVLGDFLRAVN